MVADNVNVAEDNYENKAEVCLDSPSPIEVTNPDKTMDTTHHFQLRTAKTLTTRKVGQHWVN